MNISEPPPLSIQIKWGYNPHLPALTLSFLAFSTSSGIQFLASPTNTAVDRAMHRWPAAPKAAPTSCNKTEKSIKWYVWGHSDQMDRFGHMTFVLGAGGGGDLQNKLF